MMVSMTGYGRGEGTSGANRAEAEIRSVNNRFLDISIRIPKSLSSRENEIRELIRAKLSRGKVTLSVSFSNETDSALPVTANILAAKAAYSVLQHIQRELSISTPITIHDVVQFSEVLEPAIGTEGSSDEWEAAKAAVNTSLDALLSMRTSEGNELAADLHVRMKKISETVSVIETLTAERVPNERVRLHARVTNLMNGTEKIDLNRLELEIILLADRLDVTEECVRLRSHVKYFVEAVEGPEAAGRKINFLLQEMNREINTIGSKANDAEIAHLVVGLKEELERIREQVQNIE